ncbi:ABC transporter ATP-binding protein [Microbacterium oleivorans]|uniref:ABC transporter ATP-binding protein n=1 Tax=Microbacterium oleivorans TaxID=273677 RepID=UPI00203DAB1D|nr:ABC transporter ATP-binding protein [Microbacterium oleivorans]MCM3697622.1 ABC transporter ATP-binding protein/permease [Microbacterium oleivorans]
MSRFRTARPDRTAARAARAEARAAGPIHRTLAIVRPLLRPHALLLIAGLLVLLLEVAFRVLEPWPLKLVVDSLAVSLGATGAATTGIPPATVDLLVGCGVALLVIVCLRALSSYLSTIAFALVGSRVATALRARVFDHLQALSIRFHATAPSGDIVQRLVGDVGRLQEVAVSAGLPLIGNVITLVTLAAVMMWLDPMLTVVVAASALAYWLLSRRSGTAITAASRTTRKGEGRLAESAAETLDAIRVVQAFGLERERGSVFARGNAVALREGVKARRLAAALERRTDVIVGLALALVLVGGGWQVLENRMSPGDLVVFTAYLKLAMRPLKDLAKYTGRIARAAASGERVADLLETPVEVVESPDAVPLRPHAGAVSFENVTLADGRGTPLFRGLSIDLRAGESVCLLGPSGAGKSTLAALVGRSMDPAWGRVTIDGVDLRAATLDSVRGAVSVVLQETVLFATTVRENIRHGRLGATDAEVEAAARRARAHEFIAALPDGYDTVLGGRGNTLSGGQRQRVAIARALLRDAPIVILDEATTGLDPESKHAVQRSLDELTAGRTTLTITHDPAAVTGADRVLWLEDGRIVEDGDPAALLADPGTRLSQWFRTARTAMRAEEVAS